MQLTRTSGLRLAAGLALVLTVGVAPMAATGASQTAAEDPTYDPTRFWSLDDAISPPPEKAARPRVPEPKGYAVAAGDPPGVVDIAVLGTPRAVAGAGGPEAFAAFAQSAVDQNNIAFANSGVTTRLRLVSASASATPESASVRFDLPALQRAGDGLFDEAHAIREATHADIVHLLVEGSPTDLNGGYGYVRARQDYAFAVTHRQLATSYLAFAHENGHVFGADHDPATTPIAAPPARGYTIPGKPWYTVMAYPTTCEATYGRGKCAVIPHFSNPAVAYQGSLTGTAEANNASVIEARAAEVAGFRQSQLYPVQPLVSGAVLGKKAKVDTGTWTPQASLAVQWYVDGRAIPGANSRTLKMKRKYVHKVLTVAVTGTAASYAPVSIGSTPLEVSKKLLRKTKTPKLKGKAKAGKRLTAKVKQTKPRSKISFSWYSNGAKIKGAKGRTFKLKKKHRGTYVQVQVRYKKKGYETVVKPSASKLVT